MELLSNISRLVKRWWEDISITGLIAIYLCLSTAACPVLGMDATQAISDSFLESDEEEHEEERRPLAKLCVLKNEHIPETELPLFLGENVLGRDSNSCTLPLPAPSVSKQHATICITVYRRRGFHNEEEIEALVWDLGSMNGTRKGRMKLTPNVRYALSERDSLVVADIPCQYVSCAVDTVSSQGDSRTLVSRNSGVKARLPDASGEEGGDTSTGSKTCVNGGTEALPELEDTTKTPVRTGCLSFAPTPTQPEGTLVPESDVESDGERERGADRKLQALVSDSDSHKSSPSCSTFLSPTNKTIPESEDESPITPSSTKNRSHKRVSFSMDETDVDVGRQQLKEKKALVIADDSEEEEDGEEERAALKSEEGGQHVPVKQERNVSLTGEDKLPVSRPALLTDAIPAFNMDSDTDVEGEEEGVASVGPVTLQTDQQADQPPDTAQFHMDSDTDVDEDDGALDKVTKPVPFSANNAKPPHVVSVIQPQAITMDSDTDVDDDAAVSDAGSKAQPVSFQSAHTADSAPSTQLKDFHLDSDTDVDEEEEKECGAMNTSSKIDETPSRLDIEPIGPESAPAAHHSLHSDSDTDDEGIPAPAVSEPSAMSAVTESGTAADKRADLDILSDSDTDVEADSPLVVPFVVTTLSFAPDVTSEALQSGSDADTDVDESSVPPAGEAVNPANLSVSSNTNVEDEVDFGGPGEGQIPSLCRESTPGMLAPPLQNCSTPVQSSEGQVEDMDTQAFLVPSSGPFRCAAAPAERLKALSSCSESQDEDDFALDETQSFVFQTNAPEDRTKDSTHAFGLESSGDEQGEQSTRGGSFQLGLSDSSHLQGQAQALAMESTQAFVSVDRGVNLEDTQAYAAILNAEITSLENDSNLEATQAYGEDEKPARGSVMSEKESQVDLALQATQAYISEPCSDSEDETNENETKDTASAETQPLDFPTSSTLAMAETQLMSAFKEEESVSSVLQVKPRPQSETEEKEEHGEAAHPQSVAETQPMLASDDEESDDEDLILGPRKRKAKLLHLEEEQTQPLTSCETQPMHIGVEETQPIATSGNEDSDEDGSIPGPRKSKAKQLCIEEEQTQTLTNSELSAAGTQPMDPGKDGESDEEDSIPGPRKRKAKPLQLEDEQTQSLTSSEISTAETQPIGTCGNEQSDEEDSFPGRQKRKAKPLKPEEEQTQSLTISQVSAAETQPMVTGEDGESSEEDSTPGPRKRKAKPLQIQEEETQPLTNSETSTVETQQVETKADLQLEREQSEAVTSGVTVRGKRGTRARLREEEEQAECSEPPKRQTRGKNQVLPTTRGRRGKLRPDEDESEEEEVVEQAKRTRGKKPTRQQKDDQEENLERERKEKEEKERVQAENAERLRLEQETAEKETIEKERKEREEKERADRIQKEKEQLDRERKEKEEKERLEREKVEREEKERLEREEKARIEKERKEQEEKERLETAKKELEERLEREAKENEERERLEKEKQEKEAKEKQMKEQQERLEREAKEREERETLEKERQEKEAKEKQMKEQQERLEREAKEREERERLEKEKQEKEAKEKQENKPGAPTRGRRAARRTTATTELKQEEQDDDAPARRTRSRSNSSNSVSSERSAASVKTQESSRGRGRGKGAKRTSESPQAAIARSSNRRRTVAAGPAGEDSNDISPQGVLSRSNSSNSLNSEISSCSLSSQSGRGRGGRQRGRGRKTEVHSIPPNNSQSTENSAPKPTARGRKSRKAEESSNMVPHEDDKEKADSQQATTTRGRQRANANDSKPATADEEDPSNQDEGCASEESLLPKRNVRGRGQKAVKSETVEAAPAVSDGGEGKEKRKGRKRELEANTEEDPSSSSKIPKGKEKAQGETKEEIPAQANRRGRASTGHGKDSPTEVEVKGESEKMKEEAVERRGRGRVSAVQKKKKEEQEESETSVDQDAHAEASEPRTPTSRVSRKRQAPPDSSDAPKTPRSSSASPAAKCRSRPASQTYKVLFTGVVDEEGERVLTHLGGSIAKGVADMNFLVTDKVRRTLKFLCAVAKGVPVVTTHWLEKSGRAGSFLSPNAFIVKDPEQEKKFSFCLQDSLRIASSQPLLQGYEIHVTKSVKPEPDQMKDIITCSGATFLSKMPSSHKPQTVVISCEEDWSLCAPALSASLPVVTAEFILTGILQQKVDFQTHLLSAPTSTSQPAGGRGRGRKKT